jgi:hypothetical protein
MTLSIIATNPAGRTSRDESDSTIERAHGEPLPSKSLSVATLCRRASQELIVCRLISQSAKRRVRCRNLP